MILIFSPHWN